MSSIRSTQDRFVTAILALDLGTATGWALRTPDGNIISGTQSFRPGRFEGGGMRYLRFRRWLAETKDAADCLDAIYFEEVRRHAGVDAGHAYGGFLATLTAWCEHEGIAYAGVPVGTVKKHVTGKGNADKEQVIAAVRALGHRPADGNEADALALLAVALCVSQLASAPQWQRNTANSALTRRRCCNGARAHDRQSLTRENDTHERTQQPSADRVNGAGQSE